MPTLATSLETKISTSPGSLVFRQQRHSLGELSLNLALGPENGPPLMLLHGVTRTWSDWSPVLDALTSRWTVIGVDFRGHGQSDRTPGAYRVIDYVSDTVRLLTEMADEPVVAMGHSLGAMVALAAAAEAPSLVRAVIAEDPPFHTMGDRIAATPLLDYFRQLRNLCRRQGTIAELTKGLAELPVPSPDGNGMKRLGEVRDVSSLRFAAACLKQVDQDVLEPIVAKSWLEGFDQPRILGRLRCPVLLLQADAAAGGMLTDDDAAAAERLASECWHERFAGVGHLIHWTDAPGMLRRTLAFLESLRAGEERPATRTDAASAPSGKTYRIDGHENRSRHDSHQARPVG